MLWLEDSISRCFFFFYYCSSRQLLFPPRHTHIYNRGAAATLTTSSFLPEIIKRPIGPRAWETRINIPDMTVFATGTVLWMVYCIYKSDPMITGANAIATASNVVVVLLCMKFAYSKKSTKIV